MQYKNLKCCQQNCRARLQNVDCGVSTAWWILQVRIVDSRQRYRVTEESVPFNVCICIDRARFMCACVHHIPRKKITQKTKLREHAAI